MDVLAFSLNAVLPIVILVALGYVLRRIHLMNDDFLNIGNKLVFRLFLPVMLFYNVYNIADFSQINWWFVLYGSVAIIIIFALCTAIVPLFVKANNRRGVIVQALSRSSYAIIGIPLATSLYGAAGAAAASIMSAFSIPLFNALSVMALAAFDREGNSGVNWKKMGKDIVTNPLILAGFAGIVVLGIRALFVRWGWTFRLKSFTVAGTEVDFVYKALEYVAQLATPFALIVLGGRFRFSATKELWKHITAVCVLRMLVIPAIAIAAAYFIVPSLGGEHFASYIALFASPVAVASAVMAKEMGGDDDLAGQLVVWTTLVSGFTLFAVIAVCKAVGLL